MSFYRKNKGQDQEHRNGREGSQDDQDGRETVSSQWLRAELQRYSDSNVELNDTRSKQTSSPMAVFGW
jgi:hypothetical protein